MAANRKIVGVLGGMGPDATVDFMAKVVALTPANNDQDHLQMLVNHNPTVPDRQQATPERRADVERALADMAVGLQEAGADFLVMPCNTAHGFLAEALARISIPFLNIVNETVAAVREAEPEADSVGLLAANACLQAGLYQDALHAAGLRYLNPSTVEQETVMQLIYRIKGGDQGSGVVHEMENRANSLIQQGADVIIGGCTEVPLVVSAAGLSVPFISSTDVLAARTVAICTGDAPLPAVG